MIITQTSGLATMINVFDVEPEKQQQLIQIWLEEGKQFERMPGFVSTTLHRSLDGTRVINYAQFQRAEDWENLVSRGNQQFARFKGVGTSDPHIYEIVYQKTAATAAPQVTIAPTNPVATMINVFDVEPEKQEQLVRIWLKEADKSERMPGFVSATLLRSLDGTRVINYAQFQRAEDWEENLHKRADQLFASFKSVGTSDPHIYEIVYQHIAP
jgi:heme-degrading monooxygenase HmoA